MKYPRKPFSFLAMKDPFSAVVTMRGDDGTVTFADPPRAKTQALATKLEAYPKSDQAVHRDALTLQTYVTGADKGVGMPPKTAKLDTWVKWLLELPSSQVSRLNQGVHAVTGQLDDIGEADEGN